MGLIDGVLWLVSLPFRLAVWLVNLTFWTITLPLRLIWSVVSFIGLGPLLTLSIVGAAGYALWRLVSDDEVPVPVAPPLEPTATGVPTSAPEGSNTTSA